MVIVAMTALAFVMAFLFMAIFFVFAFVMPFFLMTIFVVFIAMSFLAMILCAVLFLALFVFAMFFVTNFIAMRFVSGRLDAMLAFTFMSVIAVRRQRTLVLGHVMASMTPVIVVITARQRKQTYCRKGNQYMFLHKAILIVSCLGSTFIT